MGKKGRTQSGGQAKCPKTVKCWKRYKRSVKGGMGTLPRRVGSEKEKDIRNFAVSCSSHPTHTCHPARISTASVRLPDMVFSLFRMPQPAEVSLEVITGRNGRYQ